LDATSRTYRRLEARLTDRTVDFPIMFSMTGEGKARKAQKAPENIQALADSLLLQTYSPAAVLTNETGEILYISGRTGKYIEAAAGKVNWNIFAMAREGLRYDLTGAFQKARRKNETVTLKNIVVGTNGGTQIVNVTIQPIREQNALRGMVMIVFTDVAAPIIVKAGGKPGRVTTKSAQMEALESELKHAHQKMQTVREEMQTSQEELKSANEELQSTNEELQSTNEELTTSKEEMQSMNEELQTVNNELQANLDELSHANNDMKNLLDSTDIATIFLDNNLRVRRFTMKTSHITQLIPSDVGRPITDIASTLLYPQLAEDAREVLRTLIKVDRQLPHHDGNWFASRILPYRTLDNMIDGVVITFVDITEIKQAEEEKEKRAAELVIANKELIFQNEEKEKRAAELVIVNAHLEKLTAELKKKQ
jgi:PAS domain-containing protein